MKCYMFSGMLIEDLSETLYEFELNSLFDEKANNFDFICYVIKETLCEPNPNKVIENVCALLNSEHGIRLNEHGEVELVDAIVATRNNKDFNSIVDDIRHTVAGLTTDFTGMKLDMRSSKLRVYI